MDLVANLLSEHGPSRSSLLVAKLRDRGLTPEAARKRLSRLRPPLHSFPIPLLPKSEAFIYHVKDRETERFWANLHRDLRETDSVIGAAYDGLIARGGIVAQEEFAVISGAPLAQKRQIAGAVVLDRLVQSRLVDCSNDAELGPIVVLLPPLSDPDRSGFRARQMAERVLLDGVREWARRLGMASYNSIMIRGDDHARVVGAYKWDLTGPSYLLPVRRLTDKNEQPGFLVADAFVGNSLTNYEIKYFIRKARALQVTMKGGLLPILIAEGFSSEALTLGHKAGIVMATPSTLFGSRAGSAFHNLVETLRNAAAIVSGNPARLVDLFENLKDIEGRAGNLRGSLFELMCAYLVRQHGSIDIGRKVFDTTTGKSAEIDVLCVRGGAECTLYECKGKEPGGAVSLEEVENWLRRLPIFRAYIRNQTSLREADVRFELWTSGKFAEDALRKLEQEKQARTRMPINWKSGAEVRAECLALKEKSLASAFDQHFFRHPFSN